MGSGGPGCAVRGACRPGAARRFRRRVPVGVPDGQWVAGVGVVAHEAGPQARHERDVEAVHPHHRLGAAGMDVAVPGQPGVRMRSPGSIGTRSPSVILRARGPG